MRVQQTLRSEAKCCFCDIPLKLSTNFILQLYYRGRKLIAEGRIILKSRFVSLSQTKLDNNPCFTFKMIAFTFTLAQMNFV